MFFASLRASIDRGLLLALALAVIARVGLFGFAAVWPIANEDGLRVSPLIVQQGIDFAFYRESLRGYTEESTLDIVGRFVDFYQVPLSQQSGYIISGPVFPGLLALFRYQRDNTLPLAAVYLLISIGLAALWLLWLSRRQIATVWLLLFAVLPNPLWFMLNISSDLPFAALVALFYAAYFREQWTLRHVALWLILLLLLLGTRPNSYAILLFVVLDLAFREGLSKQRRTAAAAAMGAALVVFGFYMFPQFITTVKATNTAPIYTFFGYHQTEYLDGLFEGLPQWLDRGLSLLSLGVAKLLYFVGLRPSYSGMEWWVVLARSAAGIILLPGIVFLAIRGDRRHRFFIALFVLPVILGPSQDRYNLPIQPLLFYYGIVALDRLLNRVGMWPTLFSRAASIPQASDQNGVSASQDSPPRIR